MSVTENPCRKFQANIFQKSKCQNCFQPRASHPLHDQDLGQAKPVYGGWLLLAPEGSDFDNPLHRTRKWQRRFFTLYEHGLLRYALDEMPATLPQGTVDMNRCSDVTDGESRTAHENSLCVVTPEKELFLRAEWKEMINGWQEALSVYPTSNKQNPKKKRKVEPPAQQEPGPAKVTVTGGGDGDGIPRLPGGTADAERVPMGRAPSRQEETRRSRATAPRGPSGASFLGQPGRSQTDPAGAAQDDGGATSAGRKVRVESAYFSLEKTKSEPSPKPAQIPPAPRQPAPSSATPSSSVGAPGRACEAKARPLPPGTLARPGRPAVTSPRPSPDRQPDDGAPSREGRRAAGRGSAASATRGGAGAAASDGRPAARGTTSCETFALREKPQDLGARTQSPGREEVARLFGEERRRWRVIGRFEEGPNAEPTDTSGCGEPSSDVNDARRRGCRGEGRGLSDRCDASSDAGQERRVPDASGSAFANSPRAKSPDRGVTESAMTPDALNLKKGWMTKLDQDGTWKKHWFVLTARSLRFYKDSLAEEASEADGEIHLSTCCDVQEFPVQRNYGFRILCQGGACTLSAMTSGIRRNWIQAITKNARAAVAPDVTRSVAEANPKGRATPEPRRRVRPEPSPRPEPPDADGHGRPTGNGASAPPGEPRESGLGERRPKTLDRSEFQMDKTGEPAKERADAVDRGPSLSATASRRSSSSSSPVPTSAPPSPRVQTEDDASRPPNGVLPESPARPSLLESPERGGMEVDRPAARRDVEGETFGVSSSAKEEIERRWLQVETTPLREEKRVPIGASSENSDADGLPAQRLAAPLHEELGQKQEVLEQLQRQNSLLQEQLEDALGREQRARDGYVLQSATAPPSSARSVPRQHSHKRNRDSRSASGSPQREQVLARQRIGTLESNSAEAETAPDRREADAEAPRSRPPSASAEILASERAVARLRDELWSERHPSKEREEEYGRAEATLRARLKDGQSRLRKAEAGLSAGDVRRLRERLREVTARPLATEEGRAPTEQRLRKEQRGLRESHERKRQSPRRRTAEAEAERERTEAGLLEAKGQAEAPLGGRRGPAARERGEEWLQARREPGPKSDTSEAPAESVRTLQEEKGPLARRRRELLHQIALADREVSELCGRLQTPEADDRSVESSDERATRDFHRVSRFLREEEEESLRTEATYRSLLESKEDDLKEALVKMSALGNSLEETERELRDKEDLLAQTSRRLSDQVGAAAAAEQNLKAELAAAEKRLAELQRRLDAPRPGCARPRSEREPGRRPTSAAFASDGASPLSFGAASGTEDSADDDQSRAKPTAIPFSDARRHARHDPGDRRSFVDARNRPDFDLAEALTRAERAGDPDEFISVVRALETKLLATEEKLKSLTRTLREHRQTRASDQDPTTVANEPGRRESASRMAAGTAAYAEALLCVETSRRKVEAFLSGSHAGARLRSLSEVRHELLRASACIRRGQKTSEEQSPRRPATQTSELFQPEALPLFAQSLSFEALLLDKMALLARTSESDLLLQTLTAIREDVEKIQSADDDRLAVVYADVLARKLMFETACWEEPEREATPRGGGSNVATSPEADARAEAGVNGPAIFHALVKAELSYSLRNLRLGYEEKLRLLEGELAEARRQLSQREAASRAITDASERARLKSAVREAKADPRSGRPTSAAVCPPELAPYAERIESQEARDLAEKVLERRLADKMPPGAADPAESLPSARESLAVELQRQAAELREYAREIRSAGSRPELAQTLDAVSGPRACRPFTSASLCMREALVQSQVAYVACRLRAAHKREENGALESETGRRLDRLAQRQERPALPGERFRMPVEELKRERREESRAATRPALSEGAADGRQNPEEDPPADADAVKERRRNRVKKLKDDFERQIAEIGRGDRPVASSPTQAGERRAAALLQDRIRQLEAQIDALRDQLDNERLRGDPAGQRLKHQRDLERLKAACERGFAAMEETHRKVVEDLQRQHRREISKLTEERERLLAEETAATVAAIEAMKNAHKEELDKNRRSQLSGLDADIDQLGLQYREELQSIQRELEVLSEQYSQKCLENAHLAQALEAERQALGRCRRQNRELDAHNQELNGRLSAEIARMRSCLSGETALSAVTPGKDVYELEVLLRVKESEIQYLKQEIRSLKDELQAALRDKKYAADKHKDIYAELSIAKAKADCDVGKLKEKLHIATQALGDGTVSSGYDLMKSKSNPDFMKKEQTTTSEPSRSVRSKSLKEGLTVQEHMKLFQAKESEKI